MVVWMLDPITLVVWIGVAVFGLGCIGYAALDVYILQPRRKRRGRTYTPHEVAQVRLKAKERI